MQPVDSVPTAFTRHDHNGCCGGVLDTADRLARDEGLRLTPVRRRVLEILLEHHRAMGAYDLLERLGQEGFGTQPPVAYRALEFLVDSGFAHRIRRLNAFVACHHPNERHSPTFFICTRCNAVAEASDHTISSALDASALQIGFHIDRMNIEVAGICPNCHEVDKDEPD